MLPLLVLGAVSLGGAAYLLLNQRQPSFQIPDSGIPGGSPLAMLGGLTWQPDLSAPRQPRPPVSTPAEQREAQAASSAPKNPAPSEDVWNEPTFQLSKFVGGLFQPSDEIAAEEGDSAMDAAGTPRNSAPADSGVSGPVNWSLLGWAERNLLRGVSAKPSGRRELQDGHRFVSEALQIEHKYLTQPELVGGVRMGEYGVSATQNKQPFAGFIIHHTTITASFENILNYVSRYDANRGGQFGYHFLISREGHVVQAAPLDKRTNHVSSGSNRTAQRHLSNRNTISISFHGGYRNVGGGTEHIPPTAAQLSAGQTLLNELADLYGIPKAQTFGHGEVQSDRMREEGRSLALWAREIS